MTDQQRRDIIESARAACLKAARDAYDDAMMRGICAEGALEAALGAIEMLNLDSISRPSSREPQS